MPRLLILLLALPVGAAARAEPPRAALEFVEKRIRPALVEHCHACHGPKKQNGSLRLDSREAMQKGGDSGPALIPGDPDNSLLIQAVRHQHDLKMPPKKDRLPDAVVADLVEWVRLGAPWPDAPAERSGDAAAHWAFLPIADPPLPPVRDRQWPRTSIDAFVLARLESAAISPSPPADKRTLLRRVTFGLTGLPPTPAQTADFLADDRPHAYERVVDRLLASPAYGERWGRYWLDVARFADTRGYVFFQDANYPWAYTYRDYVIRAFNADLRYDRFILEQLAADQLGDPRALTALGFLTLGGRFMNNVHDIIDDQIDVVTRGLMGLTLTCARCHDHKYDPTTQQDYYALYGVFASCVEPEVPPLFAEPPATPEYEAFRTELESREKKLADFIENQFQQVIAGAKSRVAEYWLAVHAQGEQPPQDDFMLIADGNDLNPAMLKRWRAQIDRARRRHDPVLSPWLALAKLPEREFAARARELGAAWVASADAQRPVNPLVALAVAAKPPANLAEAAALFSTLLNDAEKAWQAARADRPDLAALADPHLEQLRLVFHGPGAAPNLARGLIEELSLFPDRPAQAKLQELRKAVEQHRISGAGAPPRAHAIVDRPTPVDPRVFLRGNPHQPGPAVPRRSPAFLGNSAPFTPGSGRLELARSIVDPANPLTARVIVNRVWQQHFGHGLVRTPADFGLRSEAPSHPELLDHLAAAFMREGWSLKTLHRRIVLSATYRQASDDRPDLAARDPENRWLARMNRRRLDFEATRDALLAVADRLDGRLGGPSAKDILAPVSTRRTMYGFVDRLQVPGVFRTFDFPSPDATAARRDETVIPQQALFFMNSPLTIACAQAVQRRPEIAGSAAAPQRVQRLYALIFNRDPLPEELAQAVAFTAANTPADWERLTQALLAANEFVVID